ncbi:cation transporter [Cumulibacter soli]|uniref:cation transporter n=1 Tax=Cumulibacter soli TaxID=2546344 RepID=UPI001FB97CCE|nr:cation transporter [Cumulibacter soli]
MLCTAATPVTVEVRGRDRRAVLRRRIRIVVAITITWNVVEAVVALSAGAVASSAALIGFGLDSIVEVLSAAAVAWQFAAPEPEKREKVALRVIAVSFFALAAYVSVDAGLSLLGLREPEHSSVGIAIAALSLAVMPFLSWFERRTGRELGSASAVADSKQTLICTYLSAALLAGLLLNSLLGWAWADPVAALVIACFAVREGIEAWRGDACCAAPVAVLAGEHDREGCDDGCCAPVTLEQENPIMEYIGALRELPIACDLTPRAGREQVEKWREFDIEFGLSAQRYTTKLVVRYERTAESIRRLRDLVGVERSCCSFVDWGIEDSGDDLRLIVSGAPDQLAALDVGIRA